MLSNFTVKIFINNRRGELEFSVGKEGIVFVESGVLCERPRDDGLFSFYNNSNNNTTCAASDALKT